MREFIYQENGKWYRALYQVKGGILCTFENRNKITVCRTYWGIILSRLKLGDVNRQQFAEINSLQKK